MHTEYRYFPFEPGQVIAYCPDRTTALSKPAPRVLAVVLRTSGTTLHQRGEGRVQFEYQHEWLNIRLVDSGKTKRIKSSKAVQAGWCATCAVPAHQHPAGGLCCPRCAGVCVEPPPDVWIARSWPETYGCSARRLAQALRTPQLSQQAIWKLLSTIDSTRRCAFEKRFNVDRYSLDPNTNRRLESAAIAEDAHRYAAVLAGVARRAAGIRALVELMCGLADDTDPLVAGQGGQLPTMPADDRTPDGEDRVTHWLAGQVARHEQRAGRA